MRQVSLIVMNPQTSPIESCACVTLCISLCFSIFNEDIVFAAWSAAPECLKTTSWRSESLIFQSTFRKHNTEHHIDRMGEKKSVWKYVRILFSSYKNITLISCFYIWMIWLPVTSVCYRYLNVNDCLLFYCVLQDLILMFMYVDRTVVGA